MGQTADELRSQIDDQRQDVSRDLEAIGDRVSPGRVVARRRARARRAWHDMRDRVMGSVDTAHESVATTTGGAADSLQSVAAGVTDTARALPERAREKAQGAPLVATAVAFGVGFVVASMLPETRAEQDLAERFEDQLGGGADQIRDQVKGMVQHVADNVSDDVQDAGRSLTDTARGAADEVKAAATE